MNKMITIPKTKDSIIPTLVFYVLMAISIVVSTDTQALLTKGIRDNLLDDFEWFSSLLEQYTWIMPMLTSMLMLFARQTIINALKKLLKKQTYWNVDWLNNDSYETNANKVLNDIAQVGIDYIKHCRKVNLTPLKKDLFDILSTKIKTNQYVSLLEKSTGKSINEMAQMLVDSLGAKYGI